MAERKAAWGRYLLVAAAAVMLAVLAMTGQNLYAKYVDQKSGQGVVIAAEFYFESDYLTDSGANYTLNAGTTSFTFTLMNHADELRFSDDDIAYTVTVSEKDDIGGTLSGQQISNQTITIDKLENGKTYTITATGTAGYEKTLSATIYVMPDDANVYKYVEDNEYYVLLTVWTKNVSGNKLTVQYPKGLTPDNTWPNMEKWTTGNEGTNEGTVNSISVYSSYTFRFLKPAGNEATSRQYTSEDFWVTLDEITATEKKPE